MTATTETLEQVLKLLIEDTKQYRQRADKQTEELRQSAARVDRALAELSEQSKQTHEQIKLELATLAKQSQAEIKQSNERFDREMAISRQEMDRSMKQLNRDLGRLSNKMGTLVEDMVSPDMLRILRQIANIPEEVPGVINVRVQREFKGNNLNGHPPIMEMDAVANCGDYALINETKSSFRSEYVTLFLAKLAQVRDYFPELAGKQIYGAIASLRIDPSVAKQAHDQGLLVLSLAEGMLELKNPPNFVPKVF